MSNLIDFLKHWFTPTTSPSKESLKELQAKTKDLEQQATYAETEAKLLDRADKAKKRIKATRKITIRPLYIIAGLVLLVIIILVIAGGC